MKKLLAIILSVILVLSLVACGETSSTEESADKKATSAPAEQATEAPTEEATAEPTATPEPTEKIVFATPSVEGLDAIITEFVTYDEEALIDQAGNECVVNNGEPWLTITRDEEGYGYVIVPFLQDDEMVAILAEEYPIISFYYRFTYGASFSPGNNAFPYEVDNNSEGLRTDVANKSCEAYITNDGAWHQIDLDISDTVDVISAWGGIRIPITNSEGMRFSLAYVGVFKTAEDAKAYNDAFVAMFGDRLVTDEPEIAKDEVIPSDIIDEFDTDVLDFNDFCSDDGLSILDDDYPWERKTGFDQSSFIEESSDNVLLYLNGDSICTEMVKSGTAYTLEFDVYHPSNEAHFGGVVLNWGNEGNKGRDFFEDNGVFPAGKGAIVSDSGVGLFFTTEDKVRIYIMTYENGKKSAITADISTGFNFANENNEYAHIKITDDAKGVISFYCNGTLFATVEYSNEKVPSSKIVGYSERYFMTGIIKDASGAELAKSENALISVYKDVAFGSRVNPIYLDNIQIKNN